MVWNDTTRSTNMRRSDGLVGLAAVTVLLAWLVAGCVPKGPHDEEGFIPTPDGPEWVSYRVEGTEAIYEGDVLFDLEELRAYQAEHVDDPHPLTAKSYDLPNGEGALLDAEYDGAGDVSTALAPLSGGLGRLADGRLPTDDNHLETVVQWSTIDPHLTFHFAQPVDLSAVRLHFRTAAGSYGTFNGFPTRVLLEMGGESFTYDPPVAKPGDSLVVVAGNLTGSLHLVGDRLDVTLVRGSWGNILQLGEVELMTGDQISAQSDLRGERWGQTIPWEIDPAMDTQEHRDAIREAMDAWEAVTDFRFVENPSASTRIRFQAHRKGCFTLHGNGRPTTFLGFGSTIRKIALLDLDGMPDCWNAPTITHELGHALGLDHEQRRHDRDEYVRYFKYYALPKGRVQFEKRGKAFGDYDYHSVMHYNEYSVNRGACCSLENVDTSGGVLPPECGYLDLVGMDSDGNGDRDACPAGRPYKRDLATMEPRMPLPTLPDGLVLGSATMSKEDAAAGNAMIEGRESEREWRSYNSLFEPADGFATQVPKQVQVGDVNGDGRDDLVAFVMGTGASGEDGDVKVRLGQADGTLGQVSTWNNWFCIDGEQCRLGDVNGDGRKDVLTFVPDGRVYVAISDGHGFYNSTLWSSTVGGTGTDFALADVNGDCREDVVAFRWVTTSSYSGYTDVRVSLTQAGGFGATSSWAQVSGYILTPVARPVLGDVNGDGRADLVSVDAYGNVNVSPSSGARFGTAETWAPGFCSGGHCKQLQILRVDDDAHGDLVAFSPDENHHLKRVEVVRSTGLDFAWEARRYHELDCRGKHCAAGDVDGDGEVDVVDMVTAGDPERVKEHREHGRVWLSLGTQLWSDPIGGVKPILTLPHCPAYLR